mmetsp:Transcript_2651/g.4439  ORF Transcript_2651/g.4439 Transcript_2651/m.4439 type:complete len:259 (-) Transcript_2651:484-1260(-)
MFGDIMHGSILTLFAIYLCLAPRKPGSLPELFAPMRYLFLLMGIFSTFCGLIYNDFTSMATLLMGDTCYVDQPAKPGALYTHGVPKDADCIYPVGIDPIWYRSTQEITFLNSFKMKVSVIYGVGQMLMGTTMKGLNALYFRRWVEFFLEVTAQILLLCALFGFMNYMIIMKWLTNWEEKAHDRTLAPSIIQSMIDMFISGGTSNQKFDILDDQKEVMQTLLVVSAVCVPILLLARPVLEKRGGHHAEVQVHDGQRLLA